MTLRSVLASLGVALAALGLGFVLVPGAAGALPLPQVGVVLLGVFALVEALRSMRARRRTPVDGADPPDPERQYETGRPGDEFDQQVAVLGRRTGHRGRPTGGSDRLDQRLSAAAVEATAHRWRLSPETARARIEAGEWTDDAAAAWYLGGPDVPRPPWSVRARAVLATGSTRAFYANRTVAAIVALREGP